MKNLARIARSSVLAMGLGACAAANQAGPLAAKEVSPMTDAFCGYLKSNRICIVQYHDMEVAYKRALDDPEMELCSILIDYRGTSRSVLLRDDTCDGLVDSYLEVDGDDSKIFMGRNDNIGKFTAELDPLYNRLKDEITEATKNEP